MSPDNSVTPASPLNGTQNAERMATEIASQPDPICGTSVGECFNGHRRVSAAIDQLTEGHDQESQ